MTAHVKHPYAGPDTAEDADTEGDRRAAAQTGRARRTRAGHPPPPPRNPEAAPLVALYRRLMPLRARRAVAGRIPLPARARLKVSLSRPQALGEGLAALRAARARRRAPALYRGADRRLVLVGGHPKAAHVRPYPSPLQAQTEALRMVCDALEAAGVRHFCVRGLFASSATVGVPENQRSHALRALTRLCAETAGYLVLGGGVRGRGRHRRRIRRRTVPGSSAPARRALAGARSARFCWYFTDRRGIAAVGERHCCAVEFWPPDPEAPELLAAPRRNRCTDRVPAAAGTVTAPLSRLTPLLPAPGPGPSATASPSPSPHSHSHSHSHAHAFRTLPVFAQRLPEDIDFPVDAVYTWVDGTDPDWLRRRAEYSGETYHAEAANAARYVSHDELRYSLRSLHQFAPWIRHVYLVTDDQTPAWLDTSHPGITVVGHREIFSDRSLLPTFNSHAIESQLHHIDGLAEHFLYLNDDVFFGRLTVPQEFFLAGGLTRFFLSKAHIPQGPPAAQDAPVAVAGKNNRELLLERFGRTITQKMKHVPHPLRRSVLAEIEEVFGERHRATAGNRFRSLDDISVTSSLHHYYAFLTGRAVAGAIPYDYFDLAHPHTEARLGRLLHARNRTVFCLNDTVSEEDDMAARRAVLEPFLRDYFPFPSPYER
ncbi:stealth family protein [Streptomyces aidingensis]|uniref:Stealth protein CR4, conserved region 4 n=1 Tax=Streptomyces aidingensis TaxID=910347 RepID=A0A1I1E3S4_9ACTN|nr:stealth family protein [Streptomyces aidingensis]SFB79580.1 Stealth protein CR4, conserved region 4 [Streptomyces aidingensis]